MCSRLEVRVFSLGARLHGGYTLGYILRAVLEAIQKDREIQKPGACGVEKEDLAARRTSKGSAAACARAEVQ